jgi:2-oxoglutarate ferredoxin oxidoreductase subunit beta
MDLKKNQNRKTLKIDQNFAFCPGCGHGIVTRLTAEVIDELNIRERAVSVVGIGCGGFSHHYMDIDAIEALHGRSPAVATGYKIARPQNVVFTYQGDGDLATIGLGEAMHAANRGIPISVIMINNFVFGMTGGQMSYTTLIGQKTTTTPHGREEQYHGFPVRVAEMMKEMDGVVFLARSSVVNPKGVIQTKKCIKNAFECQIRNLGFSYVEVLSPCPTGLKLDPVETSIWVKEKTEKYFPVKVFKNILEK